MFDIDDKMDKLPEDWEDHMLKLLIDLHYSSMPDDVKLEAIASFGELLEIGLWY